MRVQPQFPPDPSHQAGEPPLPTRASGSMHAGQLHCDTGRTGGSAAGGRGQHGETRPGGAEGISIAHTHSHAKRLSIRLMDQYVVSFQTLSKEHPSPAFIKGRDRLFDIRSFSLHLIAGTVK